MSTPANPYYEQLRLLVRLLPFVGRESCFALKGGSAINLFYRNLPRYSIDIDLTYLPGEAWADAQKNIDAALRRIAKSLTTGSPSYPVTFGRGKTGGKVDTMTVGVPGAQVKIEVNPVLRGAVVEPRELSVQPAVQQEFGFAAMNVMSFEDTFGGKLVAALDRQHPRDLFDVRLLFAEEGISDGLFKAFLVYLVGHKGSIPNVLNPFGKKVDFEGLYSGQFVRMTPTPVPLPALLETRERLAREIHRRLDAPLKRFLLSVQNAEPEWDLLGVKGAGELPAVKWRMLNVRKMTPEAREAEVKRLREVLERNG